MNSYQILLFTGIFIVVAGIILAFIFARNFVKDEDTLLLIDHIRLVVVLLTVGICVICIAVGTSVSVVRTSARVVDKSKVPETIDSKEILTYELKLENGDAQGRIAVSKKCYDSVKIGDELDVKILVNRTLNRYRYTEIVE